MYNCTFSGKVLWNCKYKIELVNSSKTIVNDIFMMLFPLFIT